MRTITRSSIVALAVGGTLAVSGPALAHVQICTPGAGDPVLEPEPFHGSMPGNAPEENFLDNPNYGSRGFHPIHESLHLSEAAAQRNITVVVVGGTGTC